MAFDRSTLMARAPSLVVIGMVSIALVGAIAGSLTAHDDDGPHGRALVTRDLRFEDRADGAVLIYDGASRTPFQVVQGEAGFLRGTLRGLARTRRSEGLDGTQPFHLAAWSDGRMTLDDPATGRHVELQAFGSANLAVFARMLPGVTVPTQPGGA